MKKREKIKPKRLTIDIKPDLHFEIKRRALKLKLTVREWVSIAITERISREMIEEI